MVGHKSMTAPSPPPPPTNTKHQTPPFYLLQLSASLSTPRLLPGILSLLTKSLNIHNKGEIGGFTWTDSRVLRVAIFPGGLWVMAARGGRKEDVQTSHVTKQTSRRHGQVGGPWRTHLVPQCVHLLLEMMCFEEKSQIGRSSTRTSSGKRGN